MSATSNNTTREFNAIDHATLVGWIRSRKRVLPTESRPEQVHQQNNRL